MTTPLFWKSLELSNKFYNLTLRYPPPLKWTPTKELAVISKAKYTLVPFSVYFSLMIVIVAFSLQVIWDGCHPQSSTLPISVLVFQIFIVGIVGLCMALIIVIYPNLHVAVQQYYNSLLHYERLGHGRGIFAVEQSSLIDILKAGT